MKCFLIISLVINFAFGQSTKPLSVESLAWLTGSWEGPINGNILEETWLAPRSGTIVALVRSTKKTETDFVEIIHIKEEDGTLSLKLQLFDNSLSPINIKAHKFALTEMSNNYIEFKGISKGAHRKLSYARPENDVFYIRFEPEKGEAVEIRLTQK